MTMAAHVSPSVDVFADARRNLELLFERIITKAFDRYYSANSRDCICKSIHRGTHRVATRNRTSATS